MEIQISIPPLSLRGQLHQGESDMPVHDDFRRKYEAYVKAAKKAWENPSRTPTEAELEDVYKAYIQCAQAFWKDVSVDNLLKLPAEGWETHFALIQTHACYKGDKIALACSGTLGTFGTIGTVGTFGSCLGTAGTAGSFGTRGGKTG
jgi:hypothetical protein